MSDMAQGLRRAGTAMGLSARFMSGLAGMATWGPWRGISEEIAVGLGHWAPASRVIQAYCKHVGLRLFKQGVGERTAVLSTGAKMIVDLNPETALYYFLGRMAMPPETFIEKLFSRALRRGDVFYDVGANAGFYALFAAPLCGPTGMVYAFEPNPTLVRNLLRSIEASGLSGRLAVHAVAVGETDCEAATLYLAPDPQQTGTASLHLHGWLETRVGLTVAVVSLDTLVSQGKIRPPEVMKIDVEGGELGVLKGARQVLRTNPPRLIVCELMSREVAHPDGPDIYAAASTPSPFQAMEFMKSYGYEWCRIGPGGQLIASSGSIDGDVQNFASMTRYVAFVRPETRRDCPELFSTPLNGS